MVEAIFFYLFSVCAIASAAMVVFARNPVHAVLFLILTFFNAAGLFILLSAEFLAMLLIVVYVGAVAVLFLFVVMMLDVDFAELKAGFIKNAPVGMLVGGIVLAELIALFSLRGFDTAPTKLPAAPITSDVTNTKAIGEILYTKYVYFFEASSMVLLVAMIGAIVLTLRHRENVRRQSVAAQVARTPETGLEIRKVKSGEYTVPPKATPEKAKEAAE